jgi:[ribosomal protein S5]-alanine N-acetyltransferase
VKPIDLAERLETRDVVLRRMRADDAAAYAGAFRDDPQLGRLLGIDVDPDEDAARERVGRTGELVVADPDTDVYWGTVLLHSYDERHRRCEVAFWLIPAARGRGVGSAAVSLIVSWAMRELDLLRVEMTTTPDNEGVAALAARLGFTREGVLRKRNVERGERVDVVWYGLLREEWTRD